MLTIALASILTAAAISSPARIVLECAEYGEKLDGPTNAIERPCIDPELYFDAGLKLDALVIRLNRPREILAGFSTGLGYGLRWSPAAWTLTPTILAIDVFAGAAYQAAFDGGTDAVTVNVLGVVTLMGFFGIGAGVQHAFGLGDVPDKTDALLTFGIATTL